MLTFFEMEAEFEKTKKKQLKKIPHPNFADYEDKKNWAEERLTIYSSPSTMT